MAISSVLNQEHISFRAGDISILTSMKGGSNLSNRQTDIQEISNDFDLLYKHSINASKKSERYLTHNWRYPYISLISVRK